MIKEAIFDLDGTFILTQPHYTKSVYAASDLINEKLDKKFSLEFIKELQMEADIQLHDTEFCDDSEKRFRTSLVKTYEKICEINNIAVDLGFSRKLFYETGGIPFNINVYQGQSLMHGVRETLDFLVNNNIERKIYTRGGDYQYEKIKFFDLYKWFKNDHEHIIVVPKKIPEDLRKIASNSESCFITDSLGDVFVSIKAGVKVFHIPMPEGYSTKWENNLHLPDSLSSQPSIYQKLGNMFEFLNIVKNHHSE